MAPGQKFNIQDSAKDPRSILNLIRDAISLKSHPLSLHSRALPGISAANIPNDAPGVRSSALLGADKISETPGVVGNRSQDAILPTLSPSSQKSSSHPDPNTSDELKKAWSMTWSALETALRLLEKSADAFPPLKSAVGGLVACLDLAQIVGENHEEYERLAIELTNMANTLAPYVTKLIAEDVGGSVERITKSIKAELAHIGQRQDRDKIRRTIHANQDQGDVLQRYRRIESLFRQLQSDISFRTLEHAKKLLEVTLLDKMHVVDEARYNSSYSMNIKRRGCIGETREKILEDLKCWVVDPKGAKVYWMNGMAETGKTTILYTLCEWLEGNARLGGNYFCSRISSSCRDVNNIVPTLAYQLAQYSPAFRSKLCKVLETKPQSSKLDVRSQFKNLLQEPMQMVEAAMPENVVVVIDALDECDDGDAFQLFLETLLKLAANLPIKFFLTSRPEPVILEKMLAPGYPHSFLYLHNIEKSIVEADNSRIMWQEPLKEGRDYINHALNILHFLEGMSEMHPIAEAVISRFKAMLLLEQIREENEMCVAAVFLAGTDTMRVFLDISEVATRNGYHSTLHPLNYDFGFETVLSRIQMTIKDCGNSIDTYYKQSRMAKFYKAQEWTARMTGYIDDFKNHRVQLQEALSLYTASNIKGLVMKMNDLNHLISRLLKIKPDWEKTLATKTQSLGDRSEWIESDAALQAVVSASEDPVLEGIATKEVESKPSDIQSIKLSELRDELDLSLDKLCNRNMDIFESELELLGTPSRTVESQEAIARSAQFVVRTLSGPYDRLLHEDLRALWKEMSWIFCVDNKTFSSGLVEYYRDHISASPIDAWTLEYIVNYGHAISIAIDSDNSGFIVISQANAFTNRIPNGWNLPQWCAYTIAGWSYECRIYRKRMHRLMFKLMEMQAQVLPHNRSYLLSIIDLCQPIFEPLAWEPRGQQLPATTIELRSLVKDKMHAQDTAFRAHLKKLQWNIQDDSVLRLVYGDMPLEQYVLQLSTLVLEQSLILAEISCKLTLEAKEWDRFIDCQLTIRNVVLARVTSLSGAPYPVFVNVTGILMRLDFSNSESFAKTEDPMEDPKTYFGGIWSSVDLKNRAYREDYLIGYTSSDVEDYYHDLSLLDDFPLPSVEGEPKTHLKYIPWEEQIKSMNEAVVRLEIPDEWDPPVVAQGGSEFRTLWGRFPFTERECDVCQIDPIAERYYGCLTCEDFDVCGSCYNNKGPSDIETDHHKMEHPVVKWTLNPRGGQRQWTTLEAIAALEDLRTDVRVGDRAGDSDEGDDDDVVTDELGLDVDETASNARGVPAFPHDQTMENVNQDAEQTETSDQAKHEGDAVNGGEEVVQVVQDPVAPPSPYICGRCSKGIDLDSTFYCCVGHSCWDFFICERCESLQSDLDAKNDDHKWWHSLLVLRKSLIEPILEIASNKFETTGTQAETQSVAVNSDLLGPDDGDQDNNPHSALISGVLSRISAVEDKFHVALTAMEDKVDSTKVALEGQLSSIEERVVKLDDSIEERMVKLDEKITELTKMLGDLIGRLNT